MQVAENLIRVFFILSVDMGNTPRVEFNAHLVTQSVECNVAVKPGFRLPEVSINDGEDKNHQQYQ